MLKKIFSIKFILVLILLTSLILVSGCSNNENGLIDTASYNVIFSVTDESDTPLKEAEITLEETTKTTDSSGIANFKKPDGSYDYNIIAAGYDTLYDTAIVDGEDVSLDVPLIISIASYNINFSITDTNDDPIERATVSLDGEGKDTDSNGMVTFSKQDGTYNYDVTAPDYVDNINNSVKVNGSDLTEEISLKLNPPDGYIGIYNWEDLNNVRNDLSADYILMNNLDSNTEGYDEYASSTADNNKGWDPIGEEEDGGFEGTFDGNNKTISNLFIDRKTEDNIGLFASINDQDVVFNLGLEEISITGNEKVGGLSGALYGSPNNNSVSNCYTTGKVIGVRYVGGLIGKAYEAEILGCHSTAEVTGSDYFCGGLLGELNFGMLSNSYATGQVVGNNWTGGLIGNVDNAYITRCYTNNFVTGDLTGGLIGRAYYANIENCYAQGDVSGLSEVGGLIGWSCEKTKIRTCYAIGEVTTDSIYAGGLVGFNNCEIRDSFSLYNESYKITFNTEGNFRGRTTEAPKVDMQSDLIYTQKTNLDGYNDMYETWDNTIWNFGTDTNPAYPSLSWE
ncbi:MAG: carboxypeptidase-like regulatory domain-containing protein [Bacillota bacterium]